MNKRMKIKLLVGIIIVLFHFTAQAQYTTDYPFDSAWVVAFNGPVFNIVDLGAIPDDEINDSPYFRMAADSIQQYGTGKLIIPAGLYIVGEQNINQNPDTSEQYYQNTEIFNIAGVNNIIIEGETGAIIRIADGLHYGSFDPLTGEVYNNYPDTVDFVKPNYVAQVGDIFFIENSTNILIDNIELDGNLQNLIVGGYWGDIGIQLEASGIKLLGSSNILIRNIHTHHHGLDGLEVGFYDLTPSSNPTVTVIENTISEYNGRQGLSWVGGIGLTAYNCKFNHTGKANISSPPGGGLDIEAETSVCRGGKFIDCEFINNSGEGMVSHSGDGGFSTFENCTFWGTTNYPIWANRPGLIFNNCNIYGTFLVAFGDVDPEMATKFNNCNFEDLLHPEFGVYVDPELPFLIHLWEPGNNISFSDCQFIANNCKSVKVTLGNFYFDNCTFTHRYTELDEAEPICVLETTTITNSSFIDDFPQGFNKTYWVQTDNTKVGECVFMTGEHVKWEGVSTNYNWIFPGNYPRTNDIEIISPSISDSLTPGNTIEIVWTSQNSSEYVGIELYYECGFHSNIIAQTENDGNYQWLVPENLENSNQYRIKVFDLASLNNFCYSDSLVILSANEIPIGTNKNFSLYPNPTTQNINFNIEDDYTFYNSLGEKVSFLKKIKLVDVSKFPVGVYYVVNSKGETLKFIKL